MPPYYIRFLMGKFDLFFISVLLLFFTYQWQANGHEVLKDFAVGLFGALLATLNASIRESRRNSDFEVIHADSIETANTESGDINIQPPSGR